MAAPIETAPHPGPAPQVAPELVLVGGSLTLGQGVDEGGNPIVVLTISTASGLGRMSLALSSPGVDELVERLKAAKPSGLVKPGPELFTPNRATRRANGHR